MKNNLINSLRFALNAVEFNLIEVIQHYKTIITFASVSLITSGTGISSKTFSLIDLAALNT
jgi:hypothetical protein